MPQNASFARSITSRWSSSTIPSTAASNTSRRCSSDWRRVSFASRTRSRARSASARARSLSPSARRASAWACVLRIWFARMRAATPIPSTPMMAADWTAESPRASSSVATVTSAAHAETTETLVRIGRTRCKVRSSGTESGRRGNQAMIAASAGPATMNTITMPGKSASNDPRVHPQPKTSVAPDTAVSTSHCRRCAGRRDPERQDAERGEQRGRHDGERARGQRCRAVGADRSDERVTDSGERRDDQRGVDRDLTAVLSGEVSLVLLASCAEHGDQEEQEHDVERSRFRVLLLQVDDEQGGRRQREQRHEDGEVPRRTPRLVEAAPPEDRHAGDRRSAATTDALAHQGLRASRRYQSAHATTAAAAATSGTTAAERARRRAEASFIPGPSCRFSPSPSITRSSDMHDRTD